MDANCCCGNAQDLLACAVNVRNAGGSRELDIGQSFIEGGHGIPEIGFGATHAAVTNTDWPDVHIIKAGGRTVGKSPWPLAANLVEAVTVPVANVPELFGKTAFVKMGPAFAMVMDLAAIGKKRPTQVVGDRQAVEGQVMEDGAEQ